MTLKGDTIFKGKLTCDLKSDIGSLVNFHVSSPKSENLHFDEFFLHKADKILDEKVHKSYVFWYWRVMQSLRKNWLLFPKMTWGSWWILMPAVASLKILILIGVNYLESILCFSRKSTEELCVITLKNDAIFKEKLTGGLKNDIRNLVNFHGSSRKFDNLHFDGSFCQWHIKFQLKKVQKSYLSWYWRVIEALKKNCEKWHEEFGER